MKTIGILGGMGPAAGAHFLRLFTKEMNRKGAVLDTDFPRIIYLGLPLEEFGVEGAKEEFKYSTSVKVCEGVRWLLDRGAEIVAVACNSVHEFYPFGAMEDQVLSIVKETLSKCKEGSRLGILCSRQTRYAKLYEIFGHKCFYAHQNLVDVIIGEVMAGGLVQLNGILDTFPNVDRIILGCTELSLCSYMVRDDIIDSSRCLAEALALSTLN